MIGKKISHYSVTAKLGEGGMGEVYRATDAKLGRDVALKLLPEVFASDSERMARFKREAQVLASLNHSNIASIYGLEETDGVHCLVLELVAGPTLADRIAQGAVPLEEVLPIASQIAEALEYAHEHGVIHRDLKPANIKLTPEGEVKILDFGLAKALQGDPAEEDLAKSPTLTAMATQAGIILGTAAYMSPEQAKGKPVDRRADIWAFGCVLYEMLAGQQAFRGETISDSLASVLKDEPAWEALPSNTPSMLRTLLRRCLNKDPRRRLRDIGEARLALEVPLKGTPQAEAEATAAPLAAPMRPSLRALAWALAGMLLLISFALSWGWWQATRPAPGPVVRFIQPFPPEQMLTSDEQPPLAISPDGSRIAYVASGTGTPQLYLRSLDRLEPTLVPGTEGALNPFFSPDGQWIGFFAEGKLKKVQASGGAAFTLAEASGQPRGASWGPGDNIVFAPTTAEGLKGVSGGGGPVREVSQLDASKQERTHRWPQVLPDGKHALFIAGTLDSPEYYDDSDVDVVSLETGERQTVLHGASMARYAPSGHLIYARGGSLWAVPFNLRQLRTTGSPVPVVEGVTTYVSSGGVYFAVAENGTLIYVPGGSSSGQNQLAWADRFGKLQVLPLPAGNFTEPRLSPDGRQVALVVGGGKTTDIWIYDIARNTFGRLSFEGSNRGPAWSPDGKSVTYWSVRGATEAGLYQKPADGSGEARLLLPSSNLILANSWSPDGKYLAIDRLTPTTQSDITVVSTGNDPKEIPFVTTRFDEYEAAFSPDGHWIAYISSESGRYEVYVKPFPGPGGKWQVSTDGGTNPLWSQDGREIFYVSGDRMLAVKVESRSGFKAGTPEVLFSGFFNPNVGDQAYGVAPDGQRFLVIQPLRAASANPQINVVLNWFEEVRRHVPSDRK